MKITRFALSSLFLCMRYDNSTARFEREHVGFLLQTSCEDMSRNASSVHHSSLHAHGPFLQVECYPQADVDLDAILGEVCKATRDFVLNLCAPSIDEWLLSHNYACARARAHTHTHTHVYTCVIQCISCFSAPRCSPCMASQL
jgi:hypothetical protein